MEREYNDWRVMGPCSTLPPSEYDTLFFPEKGRSINKAKAFCKNCPVILDCLEYALKNNEDGIWAGTCKKERDRIMQSRGEKSRYKTPHRSLINVRNGKAKVVRRSFIFT